MHKYLLTAVAAAAIATPALARDGSGYVGLEGGALFPNSTKVDVDVTDSTGADVGSFDNAFRIKNKTGYDVDLIGGYDFGMFRLEGELGYKRAKLDRLRLDPALRTAIEDEIGGPLTDDDLDLSGHTSVVSGMINGLADFGGQGGFGGYLGAGVGRAGVKFSGGGDSDSDSAWAWQILAGVYAPVSDNIDVGLKYRYFRTGKLHFNQDLDFGGDTFGTDLNGHFSSHSLLASLVFNFGAAAAAPEPVLAPPPPAPAAPATQTCPDGSVILATSACPVPPPPPPPPPVERGERGQ
jgi:opacity protein-like surface antigen